MQAVRMPAHMMPQQELQHRHTQTKFTLLTKQAMAWQVHALLSVRLLQAQMPGQHHKASAAHTTIVLCYKYYSPWQGLQHVLQRTSFASCGSLPTMYCL
jgi:hypothetical protein